MQLTSLHIQQNDAKIGIRSSRPGPQIRQQGPDMQIRQNHHNLIEISTTASKMHIDQTEAFADANLKSPIRVASETAAKAMQQVSKFFAKTAQQGDQLMKIENGPGAIARMAKINSEPARVQVNIGYMPKSPDRVKFHFEPAQVNIRARVKDTEITVNRRAPQIEMPKWQSDVYIRQKNQISFQPVGDHVNLGL
ncbi:DUF6470 family protein [Halalkalibacter alkalisediminis]|uniref:DUF6470 family protein n=1 Tax=Halalkalibacter alkalisediminis TaxID=935616 RepID=A0ABV6NEX7_9BACI|nr:DUF6470 family protein [Halalkalibacter alkalisediminis]